MGKGNDSSSTLPSSSSPLSSSSFSQSNESSGIGEINNQSSSPSLTTQSSSSDQTLANIFNKVSPLIGLLMGGGDSSIDIDEGQGSSAYFSNGMNDNFDNSSSLSATNDYATSESTYKPPYYVGEFWLRNGTGEGESISPQGIVLDSHNNTYVADYVENKIQKRENSHNFTTWGSYGTGDGQFSGPRNMALDSFDNVYVSDSLNNRIQKFDSNGTFISTWGSVGTNDGQFVFPLGIAIDSLDNIYVVDMGTNRVQKFDSNGTFITAWQISAPGDSIGIKDIAIDLSNNVYVSDSLNNRIQKFDSNGTFIVDATSFTGSPTSIAAGPDSLFVIADGRQSIVEYHNNLTYVSAFHASALKSDMLINDIYVDPNKNIFATLEGEGFGKELIGVNMKIVKIVPQPDDTSIY
jgi:streptogramin lyase